MLNMVRKFLSLYWKNYGKSPMLNIESLAIDKELIEGKETMTRLNYF